MVRKRFKFIKDFSNVAGGIIPKGTIIDIIDNKIFMQSNTFGGQILESKMYDMIHTFIEQEYKNPNYLQEIPVPYNKC